MAFSARAWLVRARPSLVHRAAVRWFSFTALGVRAPLVQALASIGVTEPTSVQRAAWQAARHGQSCLITAQTGSGKTLAALLPALERISDAESDTQALGVGRSASGAGIVTVDGVSRPLSLLLCPSRELVSQHRALGKSLSHGGLRARFESLDVEAGLAKEKRELGVADKRAMHAMKPLSCLVCTPGRLLSLVRRGVVSLARVHCVLIDEADTMTAADRHRPSDRGSDGVKSHHVKQGFAAQIQEIVARVTASRTYSRAPIPPCQVIAIAATMSSVERAQVTALLPGLVPVTDASLHSLPPSLRMEWLPVGARDKLDVLVSRVQQLAPSPTLIFCNSLSSCRAVELALSNRGFHEAVAAFHGSVPARVRSAAYREFLQGARWLLVATDLGSRGLDLPNLCHTLQFDMARNTGDFLHRVGRTHRAATPAQLRAKQSAIVLVTKHDETLRREIESQHVRGQPIHAHSAAALAQQRSSHAVTSATNAARALHSARIPSSAATTPLTRSRTRPFIDTPTRTSNSVHTTIPTRASGVARTRQRRDQDRGRTRPVLVAAEKRADRRAAFAERSRTRWHQRARVH